MQNSVILGILFKLINKRKILAKDLAVHFGVSTRTVFRYLDVLEGAGVPIMREAGKNGGISIMDSYKLDRLYFTKEEKLRLSSALKLSAPNYNDNLSQHLLDKLTALSSSDKDDTYLLMTDTLVIDSSGWNDADKYRHTISAINMGIHNNNVLMLVYKDRVNEESQRLVEPHTLVLKEGVFYVYAYCQMRKDFRLFKLARIQGVSVLNTKFTRREVASHAWNSPFDRHNLSLVCMKVSPELLPELEEWLNVTEGENGMVSALMPITNGTIRRLLSFGCQLEVVSPPHVRERIIDESANITKRYNQ